MDVYASILVATTGVTVEEVAALLLLGSSKCKYYIFVESIKASKKCLVG